MSETKSLFLALLLSGSIIAAIEYLPSYSTKGTDNLDALMAAGVANAIVSAEHCRICGQPALYAVYKKVGNASPQLDGFYCSRHAEERAKQLRGPNVTKWTMYFVLACFMVPGFTKSLRGGTFWRSKGSTGRNTH